MSIHPSKASSVLQWFNALTTNINAQSLSQFADGALFCDIVTTVYCQADVDVSVLKYSCSVQEEGDVSTSQQMDVVEGKEEATKIHKKYEEVEKFIDTFFQMKSSSLITYSDCIQGKEMELAKVAVLLLSALVQYLLSSNNHGVLDTITLLEPPGVQEDIKECLSLLLERDAREGPLTKADLHKVLGHASKYKATPRRSTPHRGRKDKVTALMYEAGDSPLKELIQSPNNSQHRVAVAMFQKETELCKLRNALHAEEVKVVDLSLEKRDLSKDLEKRTDDWESLKDQLREQREAAEVAANRANTERAEFLAQIEKLNISYCTLKEDFKMLKSENTRLNKENEDLEDKVKLNNDQKEAKHSELLADTAKQIKDIREENKCKEQELQECKKQVEALEEELKSYKDIYEEMRTQRRSPVTTPSAPEVVSKIYDIDAVENQLNVATEQIADLMKQMGEKDHEISRINKLLLKSENQLKKEKTVNLSAVLQQLSSLQEKYDNLVKQTKGCATCGSGPETEENLNAGSSSAVWDKHLRGENAPKTRSRYSTTANTGAPSTTVTPNVQLEKLKTILRSFCKLVFKSKLVKEDDHEARTLLRQIDAQSRSQSTSIEDVLKTFELLIGLMKKQAEIVRGDLQAKEVAEQLQSLLTEKEKELKVANEAIETLKTEAGKAKYDFQRRSKQYTDLHLRHSILNQNIEILKNELYEEREKKKEEEEPCPDCARLIRKLTDAKEALKKAAKKEEQFAMVRAKHVATVEDYENRIKNHEKERIYLKHKIQEEQAFNGNTLARSLVVDRYYRRGKEQAAREREARENRSIGQEMEEPLQPVVNVNTYIVHPEKRNPPCETSTSSQFASRTINSAYLQTEDEEDFLNHSSLAQIQQPYQQSPPAPPEDRLRELQRRNSFYPRHLQSSYPMELQGMTPEQIRFALDPPFHVGALPTLTTKSRPIVAKKRKVSEPDTTTRHVVMGPNGLPKKVRTPLRSGPLGKTSFRTPSSIRRLIGLKERKKTPKGTIYTRIE